MSHSEPGHAFATREVLDEAVRCLALSAAPLAERARAACVVVANGLYESDFAEAEDRELVGAILAALRASAGPMSQSAAAQAAADILDLRDTITGRAIGNALGRSHSGPRRGARRRGRK